MKWFTKKALRKQKLRVRESPKPKAPAPKYVAPREQPRGPKIVKPRVELPFVGSGLNVTANPHRQDMSLSALQSVQAEAAMHGGIVSVDWNLSGAACTKCQIAQEAGPWDSVQSFLNGRPMAVSPNGKPVGIFGYSHPDCSCTLTIYYGDEQTATVSP